MDEYPICAARRSDMTCFQNQCEHYRAKVTAETCSKCPVRVESLDAIPLPNLRQKIKGFRDSIGLAIKVGWRFVSREHFEARMKICDGCKWRIGGDCKACGCKILAKGQLRAWTCDLGLWKQADEDHQ